jgi:class 3 adenylate cyclase/tetratricopeptide (TPR) repeat protein
MKCTKCNFENRPGVKFCEECGAPLGTLCPNCGAQMPPMAKFCGECGQAAAAVDPQRRPSAIIGQRKLVTVLFSDLTGFTTLTERLDSEEVKDIMDGIFGRIAQVVAKYEGFIEKFIGDAVMAIFGAPKAHEDDAVRAIKAAMEIHELVEVTGSRLKHRTGQTLLMHSGIDSGVVVTGEMDLQKSGLRFAGDTINRAARLCSTAQPGEILVGTETHREAEAYFHFEKCDTAHVKGKSEPLMFHKVTSCKVPASKTQRMGSFRAPLVGRSLELAQLAEAKERLEGGNGTIVSICGEAGTGKSRLIEEFKASLDLTKFHWLEAHAYAYNQNIPYWPLMELLNRSWRIEEDDSLGRVQDKIARGVSELVGNNPWVSSRIASLYGQTSPDLDEMSPELWKSQLFEAVHSLLAARAQISPTVVLLEDLHWVDSASMELLRSIISEQRYPAIFLCSYRPPFTLFTTPQLDALGRSYRDIRLEDLSPSETQVFTESLLETSEVPFELRQFLQEMTGGNPFYLEEVIHSMMESGILLRDQDGWKCTRSLSESGICSTVQGVISARLDHLSGEAKRLLQEASVIGRAFLYQILENVTACGGGLEQCLSGLERMDLIRARSLQPDLEYVFKHALTHEVVYNGLLKKERRAVHERIGHVMEHLFQDRLPEFYETLAFHFKQGKSSLKAVDYLVKSGEKSLRRYAVDESHRYFEEAFQLLTQNLDTIAEARPALIDLLIKWAFVHYYSGHYAKLLDLLEAHRALAESLTDKSKLGMFYAWLGWTMWHRERLRGAKEYLSRAIELGEEAGDLHVIAYACGWLTWTCADLGLLEEGEKHGERAREIAGSLVDSEHHLYSSALAGLGYLYWHKGEKQKAFDIGQTLVEYGHKCFNVRSVVMGHTCIAFSHFVAGDFLAALSSFQEATRVSIDPWYSQFPKMGVCYSLALAGQFDGLEEPLREIVAFGEERGAEYIGSATRLILGATLVANGKVNQGMKMIEDVQKWWLDRGSRTRYLQGTYTAGRIYAQIARGGKLKLSTFARNFGFMLKKAPFAGQKALEYLSTAGEMAEEIGARGHSSKCWHSIGLLYKAKGDAPQAEKYLTRALSLFRECGAEVHVKEVEEALKSL